MTSTPTPQPGDAPGLNRLVDDAEQAHARAEAGLRAAIDGIEAAMDRLAHLGRVAAIARAVRAEAERDRLLALLEGSGGDQAAAEAARLRSELAEARAVGRCGAHPPTVTLVSCLPAPCCTLPAGHPGWHKDATTGSEWTPEPAEIEYAIEVLEDGTWGWCLTDRDRMRTPAAVLDTLERVRASNPGEQYRATVRAIPPFRPLPDGQLAAMTDQDAEAGR